MAAMTVFPLSLAGTLASLPGFRCLGLEKTIFTILMSIDISMAGAVVISSCPASQSWSRGIEIIYRGKSTNVQHDFAFDTEYDKTTPPRSVKQYVIFVVSECHKMLHCQFPPSLDYESADFGVLEPGLYEMVLHDRGHRYVSAAVSFEGDRVSIV
ncbi:hypothetical protein EG328_005350 [Venturia inaequalis]|uniref:Uncharacterized protein n=1 Tax=Venturia inaequalis TaxID=5025 RepID=A0A8H3UK97_VENIN|nr:hypothetical protein EG328_005350 [Venturia inaequalis]